MKTVEDFKRAFKIRWFYVEPCYRAHIPGYETICFHQLWNIDGKPHLYYSEYAYSWGGCSYYDDIFVITSDDFDDNMTDEEMQQRLIEIVREKKPELVKLAKLQTK